MANPYFTRNPAFAQRGAANAATIDQLERQFQAGSATAADTERMTYEGVITKTSGLLILLGLTAAATWVVGGERAGLFAIAGAIVGIVLALIIIFKRSTNPRLIGAYAVAEGVFLGGLSALIESDPAMQGVALQALMATGITAAVCLWLYRSGRVRVTAGFQRVLLIGMVSYGIFALVNLGLILFTDIGGWGLRSEVEIGGIPLGVIVGAVAVILASMSLIADFDGIKNGVERGAPRPQEWAASFGLVVTLVWLYLEFLRILAILRGR